MYLMSKSCAANVGSCQNGDFSERLLRGSEKSYRAPDALCNDCRNGQRPEVEEPHTGVDVATPRREGNERVERRATTWPSSITL